ncbi:MAG: hypothetical protein AABY34_03550, partial [Pseudomonadota bacterium]
LARYHPDQFVRAFEWLKEKLSKKHLITCLNVQTKDGWTFLMRPVQTHPDHFVHALETLKTYIAESILQITGEEAKEPASCRQEILTFMRRHQELIPTVVDYVIKNRPADAQNDFLREIANIYDQQFVKQIVGFFTPEERLTDKLQKVGPPVSISCVPTR